LGEKGRVNEVSVLVRVICILVQLESPSTAPAL
jgi:hypothetical protein